MVTGIVGSREVGAKGWEEETGGSFQQDQLPKREKKREEKREDVGGSLKSENQQEQLPPLSDFCRLCYCRFNNFLKVF